MRTGVYPGTFNPPTVAHLAIARAARHQRRLDRVVLALSVRPIDKEHVAVPTFADRLAVVRAAAAEEGDWLDVEVTEHRLLVDIARGHDVLIMGADKWHQVLDVSYYGGGPAERDAAVADLPELAVAPRAGLDVPAHHLLDLDAHHDAVSSSAVRAGAHAWMCAAAADFDRRTGAWSDPARYERLRITPGEHHPD